MAISGLNHPNFGFFGLVPKSPIHTGLIYVKNPKPNISCLGPFKTYGSGWPNQDLCNGKPLSGCPASQVKKTRRTYLIRTYSAGPVSQICYWSKRRELLSAATLEDSITPTPVLHKTSVVVWNLYCVRVIIVRLNKLSKPRSFVYN
jgi:hypothetical protein